MNLKCLADLRDALTAAHPGCRADAAFAIPWDPCPAGQNGDITVNCFRFAKDFSCVEKLYECRMETSDAPHPEKSKSQPDEKSH